jgi:hypothetical protein
MIISKKRQYRDTASIREPGLKTIDTSLPFAELRRLSYIDYRARDADDDPTFSILIRKGIPGIP